MIFLCDRKRHLICRPYSIKNLHKMAYKLGLNRCWFHKDHYDIPKKRVTAITMACRIVSTREIVRTIKRYHERTKTESRRRSHRAVSE